jgi:hypothetical protein
MKEVEKKKRVIDMMITMHSVLRDKYKFLSSSFEISLLLASVALNALVFVDSNSMSKALSIRVEALQFMTGVFSVSVFAISLVLLQVKWKEKADEHSKAAELLFQLLQESKRVLSLPNDTNEKSIEEFDKNYVHINSLICKIPDRKFNALKSKHYRKIELSKLIDRYPGSMFVVLKWRLFLYSLKEKTNE